jgi:hypothetical protein
MPCIDLAAVLRRRSVRAASKPLPASITRLTPAEGKKAMGHACTLRETDRNNFVEEVYEINSSAAMRQERPMDSADS